VVVLVMGEMLVELELLTKDMLAVMELLLLVVLAEVVERQQLVETLVGVVVVRAALEFLHLLMVHPHLGLVAVVVVLELT
jgi:hypothetical protein